jgi:hypothetical protein
MVASTKKYNLVGNQLCADGMDITFNAMTNVDIPAASRPSITAGTGAPTFAAAQGSLYIRIDGGAGARLYMNSTGSTTWIVAGSAA